MHAILKSFAEEFERLSRHDISKEYRKALIDAANALRHLASFY